MKLSNNHKKLINSIILAVVPLVSCLIRLILDRKGFKDIWLGQSTWNDEFFYFKQIECIVMDGMPRGIFGYNESVANLGTLGAWSPTIFLPWVILAKLFGLTYSSLIVENIVYFSIALFAFGMLSRIDIKKTLVLSAVLLITTPLSRYTFSFMPEIVIISAIVVFLGLVLGYEDSQRKSFRLWSMLVTIVWLVSVRPYFIVLFLFPFLLCGTLKEKKERMISRWIVIVAAVVSVVLFEFLEQFKAPYLGDVYFTDVLTQGVASIVKQIVFFMGAVIRACYGGIKSGYAIGIYFGAFGIVSLIMFVLAIKGTVKKDGKSKLLWAAVLINVIILLAIILLYNLQDGYRHLLGFIVMGEILIVAFSDRFHISELFLWLSFVVLFVARAKDPIYFEVPYANDTIEASTVFSNGVVFTKEEALKIREELSEKMILTDETSFDNTVCIMFMDYDREADEATKEMIAWQYGYAIPKGFAVTLCTDEYVESNVNDLKSRFIMARADGHIESLIEQKAECLYKNGKICFYKLR